MAGDGDLRVGPWVPAPGDTPGEPPATAPVAEEGPRNWWDDLPDPWDRPYQTDDEDPTSDIHQGRSEEAGRSERDTRPRRIAAVVVAFGVVLVGTGVLVNVLSPGQEVELAPPPRPPEQVVTSPPDSITDLGLAPTVAPSPDPPTGSPPPDDRTTPPAAPTAPAAESYEAEDAELGWFTDAYSDDAASGGSAVEMGTFLGMGGSVRFDEVAAAEAGRYELTVHYLSDRNRAAQITVNGGDSTTMDFPGVDGDHPVGTVSLPVDLVAGDNTIVFEPDGGSAPDLDHIEIS